jgi:hypothetical protein
MTKILGINIFSMEHIMNRHLAQVLVFFVSGFEDDYSDLGLELFK